MGRLTLGRLTVLATFGAAACVALRQLLRRRRLIGATGLKCTTVIPAVCGPNCASPQSGLKGPQCVPQVAQNPDGVTEPHSVLLIHGTAAASVEDAGERWWQ